MRLDDTLAALEAPTLFVLGASDPLAPAGIARAMAKRMSDAKLTLIEDAGSHPAPRSAMSWGGAGQPVPSPARVVRRAPFA